MTTALKAEAEQWTLKSPEDIYSALQKFDTPFHIFFYISLMHLLRIFMFLGKIGLFNPTMSSVGRSVCGLPQAV